MRPLENNISERTEVLEVRIELSIQLPNLLTCACAHQTEHCIIIAQSFVRRWLVRKHHMAECMFALFPHSAGEHYLTKSIQ